MRPSVAAAAAATAGSLLRSCGATSVTACASRRFPIELSTPTSSDPFSRVTARRSASSAEGSGIISNAYRAACANSGLSSKAASGATASFCPITPRACAALTFSRRGASVFKTAISASAEGCWARANCVASSRPATDINIYFIILKGSLFNKFAIPRAQPVSADDPPPRRLQTPRSQDSSAYRASTRR